MKSSFVIPSFNSAAWLPHAVKSCEKQTYKDIEIVIVNDGSTDSTKDYLEWLEHNKEVPTKIINIENVGRSKARNIGNKEATGDVIFVLDSDDYSHPDRVNRTLDKINKGADFVYGSAEVMDFSGTKQGDIIADVFKIDKALETRENRIVHSTVAYTKKLALEVPYCEDKEISDNGLDDWFQQLEVASKGYKFDFVTSSLVAYRVLQSAVTQWRDHMIVNEVKNKYLDRFKAVAC